MAKKATPPGPRSAADLVDDSGGGVGGGGDSSLAVDHSATAPLGHSATSDIAPIDDESGTASGDGAERLPTPREDLDAALRDEADAAMDAAGDAPHPVDLHLTDFVDALTADVNEFVAGLAKDAADLNDAVQACSDADRASLLPPAAPDKDAVALALGEWTLTATEEEILAWRQEMVDKANALRAASAKIDEAQRKLLSAADRAVRRRFELAQLLLLPAATRRAKLAKTLAEAQAAAKAG